MLDSKTWKYERNTYKSNGNKRTYMKETVCSECPGARAIPESSAMPRPSAHLRASTTEARKQSTDS